MQIINANIITPSGIVPNGRCLLRDGIIEAVSAADDPLINHAETLDAKGSYLAPGLIDLQLNGAFGHDFTRSPSTIWQVAAELPRFGVTAFLPTIITSPLEAIQQAQTVLNNRPSGWIGAEPLGLHAEGPFLNPVKKGAHNSKFIRTADSIPDSHFDDWTPHHGIRLVTLAPETAGALPLIEKLAGQNVIVSAGHSAATFTQAQAGFEAGIRYVTHLFNAMPPLHHREPGLAAAALADRRITIGIIPDGVHVHPELVKLVWQLAANRLNGVTDAMSAMGSTPGSYALGDYTVTVSETDARLPDGTLAGSIIQPQQVIERLAQFTGCDLASAVGSMTNVPADLLGIGGRKGRIQPGLDAELILFDESFNIQKTIIGGEIVYDRK